MDRYTIAIAGLCLTFALALGIGQMLQENKGLVITEASCNEAGGYWNACGSACRGMSEDEACISLCVEQCECANDSECPSGFACEDIIGEFGVCERR
jgi:hypothetical protein